MKWTFTLFLTACVLLAATAAMGSHAVGCATTIVPDPGPRGGRNSCTYTYVPFETSTYSGGHLSASWSADYQILESFIVSDGEVVASYIPGSNILFAPVPGRQHYDFLGRFRVLASGEELLTITPIWCLRSSQIPAAFNTCYEVSGADDCSLTSRAKNCPGTKVTCEGDHGTCSDCGNDNEACCTATITTESPLPNGGTHKVVEIVTDSKPCPPPPPPPPQP